MVTIQPYLLQYGQVGLFLWKQGARLELQLPHQGRRRFPRFTARVGALLSHSLDDVLALLVTLDQVFADVRKASQGP